MKLRLYLTISALFIVLVCILLKVWYKRYEHLPQLDILDNVIIQKGFSEIKKHRVVIMGITRDNAKHLPKVIRHIKLTGEQFADYRVIIFENDSIDGTKNILKKWQDGDSRVKIIIRTLAISKDQA